MKKAEVQLPEGLYQEVEGLADQLHLTVPELLLHAAQQLVSRRPVITRKANDNWQFPEARHLGKFAVPAADWRLLANEAAD
ncbi:MAG TPA: hypothetical protein VG347_02735 [Verrucomicrobiae bacterium]|nr:hypothetical protein [Verrucomicrobiae bacterium]